MCSLLVWLFEADALQLDAMFLCCLAQVVSTAVCYGDCGGFMPCMFVCVRAQMWVVLRAGMSLEVKV